MNAGSCNLTHDYMAIEEKCTRQKVIFKYTVLLNGIKLNDSLDKGT